MKNVHKEIEKVDTEKIFCQFKGVYLPIWVENLQKEFTDTFKSSAPHPLYAPDPDIKGTVTIAIFDEIFENYPSSAFFHREEHVMHNGRVLGRFNKDWSPKSKDLSLDMEGGKKFFSE